MDKCDASWEIDSKASFSQAPHNSTTNDTHTQASSSHLASFEQCFLCSVVRAAAPVVTLASKIIVGLSGDVTDRLKAADLHRTQFGTKLGGKAQWVTEVSRSSL